MAQQEAGQVSGEELLREGGHSNPQATVFLSRIETLERFFNEKKSYAPEEIVKWVAESVELFSELRLSSEIISGFMKTFEHHPPTLRYNRLGVSLTVGQAERRTIGPLMQQGQAIWEPYSLDSKEAWNPGISPNTQRIYYVHIAFTAARRAVQIMKEADGLVPGYLFKALDEKRHANILASLQLLENAYREKRPHELVGNAVSLLEVVMDLEPQLKTRSKLVKKIELLRASPELMSKFGISNDFLTALDNSRLLRNYKIAHKTRPIKYDLPFLVAASCASLSVLFLEISLSTGEMFPVE